MGDVARTLTRLLRDWRDGDGAAADELMPLVYRELHRLASRALGREGRPHTLRPTELIGEAYLRLSGGAQPEWNDRAHFFAIAARTMRQILVDHARKQCAAKRGARERPVALNEDVVATDKPAELVALHEALDELATFDERKARAVELHYFGGLTHEEIANVLDIHVNTVGRDLTVAEAWIHRRMTA